ncbi:hypothetical protein AFEL58S_00912 [Afipia felis]
MTGLLRSILAGCLALALIASGAPHLRVAGAAPAHDAVHVDGDTGAHMSLAQHDATLVMHQHSESGVPAEQSGDICKDMTCCTMCAAAYVEPATRIPAPARVVLAVRYDVTSASRAEASIGPDPGIPIAV